MSEQIISKQCHTCKQIKPITEFYKHSETKDLHFSKCKTCCLKYAKEYRQSEKGKAYQKRYQQSEKGKIIRYKAWSRYAATEKGKAARKCYRQSKEGKVITKRYHVRHPERDKAHHAVNHAIRAGRLLRPNTLQCHYCPAQAKQYHHWHGYEPEHWLDVVPVCIPCHNKIPKYRALSRPGRPLAASRSDGCSSTHAFYYQPG